MSGKDWWQRAKKPFGGFIFMTVTQICMVWWSYRHHSITLKELRVYFALHEMVARRCEKAPDVPATYTPKEAQNLISGTGAKAAIGNLQALGHIEFSENRITFATSPDQLHINDLDGLHDMIAKVRNNARRVPVPRQIVRLIASCWKSTVIATALGHLFTGIYYKAGQCVSGGYCKASWLADVFSVDERGIKRARKFLAEDLKQTSGLSWLTLQPTPQWQLNKLGQGFLINLEWQRQDLEAGRVAAETAPPVENATMAEQKPPPPAAQNIAKPPPPYINTEPLREVNNKTPLEPGSQTDTKSAPNEHTKPGFAGNTNPASGESVVKKLSVKKESQAPMLDKLIEADLSDVERGKALHQQAVERELAEPSQEGLVLFIALMEVAKLRGTKNPQGYFLQLLKRQAWDAITNDDRVNAKRRLGLPVRERPDRVFVTAHTFAAPSEETTPEEKEQAYETARASLAQMKNKRAAQEFAEMLDRHESRTIREKEAA